MRILVSACLLGRNCKYDGGNNYDPKVAAFVEGHQVIPVCPETAAGMSTPRTPIEIVDGVVMDREGNNVDAPLRAAAVRLAEEAGPIDCAILKSRSPTCGPREVYDGTFTHTLRKGAGVLAQVLLDRGCRVIDAEEL